MGRLGQFVSAPPGMIFVDRGDPAGSDWTQAGLTMDNAWHDLDMSGVVPAGTKAVLVRICTKSAGVGDYLQIRKKGNANALNVITCKTIVAAVQQWVDGTVFCNGDRKVQYLASVAFTNILITIGGWWI